MPGDSREWGALIGAGDRLARFGTLAHSIALVSANCGGRASLPLASLDAGVADL